MSNNRLRKVVLAIVAIGVTAGGAGYAFAAAQPIAASTGSNSFAQPTFTIDQGEVATFQNPSATSHNVTASGSGPDRGPLFKSSTIASGQAPVQGTQYLSAGNYHFICTIHGPSMSADLVVTGNGAPLARPAIKLKVLSRSLSKVLSSRRLKVKVSAATQSNGITLTARKGARKLGSKRNLSLGAGTSRAVKLALTGAGRKALENAGSAKVKVTGSVPFGSPATASRRLH